MSPGAVGNRLVKDRGWGAPCQVSNRNEYIFQRAKEFFLVFVLTILILNITVYDISTNNWLCHSWYLLLSNSCLSYQVDWWSLYLNKYVANLVSNSFLINSKLFFPTYPIFWKHLQASFTIFIYFIIAQKHHIKHSYPSIMQEVRQDAPS